MRSLRTLFALCILVAPAVMASDTVAVNGTADVTDVVPEYLSQIGFDARAGGTLEFSYSYRLTGEEVSTTPGYFTVRSFDGSHNLIDTLDFNPFQVSVVVRDNFTVDNQTFDEYGAQINYFENGLSVLLGLFLVDKDAAVLMTDPETYISLVHDWEESDIGIGIDIDHVDKHYTTLIAELTSLDVTVTPDPDPDGDGVLNADDKCADTPNGQPVNADGCSIDQLVPCGGPAGGGKWKNHGQYQSEVAKTANEFFKQGLITDDERKAIINAAAQSGCGR